MEKSLWSIHFTSSIKDFGFGVVVLDGNQAVGGDFGFYYLGNFNISGNSFTAKITATKFNPQVTSIFGNIASFNLALTGNINGNQISLSGQVEEFPQMTMTATMNKLVNLT